MLLALLPHSADSRNPYVYAHTSTDVLHLASQMERLAEASPDGHALLIHVVTPENYWPLPWYLRRFERVGYWHEAAAWRADTAGQAPPAVVLLTDEVQPQIDASLPSGYNRQMIFGLRPGVLVMAYAREDLWKAFLAAAEKPAD